MNDYYDKDLTKYAFKQLGLSYYVPVDIFKAGWKGLFGEDLPARDEVAYEDELKESISDAAVSSYSSYD